MSSNHFSPSSGHRLNLHCNQISCILNCARKTTNLQIATRNAMKKLGKLVDSFLNFLLQQTRSFRRPPHINFASLRESKTGHTNSKHFLILLSISSFG